MTPSQQSSAPLPLSSRQLKALLKEGRSAMVAFFSPTCPHCATLEPTIERLAQERGEQVLVGQLDLSSERAASREWSILSTPTVLFFKAGEEIERLTGVQNGFQYRRALDKVEAE